MIKLICALDQNRTIGLDGKMPWHFPEDLQHFQHLTSNHPIIMGRRTFESIGHPLLHRLNIVLSKDEQFHPEGCLVFSSLKQALEFTQEKDVFIIGGQQLFEQTIDLADEIYLTEIHSEFQGDTFFPEFDKTLFSKEILKTTQFPYKADFCRYLRITSNKVKDH